MIKVFVQQQSGFSSNVFFGKACEAFHGADHCRSAAWRVRRVVHCLPLALPHLLQATVSLRDRCLDFGDLCALVVFQVFPETSDVPSSALSRRLRLVNLIAPMKTKLCWGIAIPSTSRSCETVETSKYGTST